MPSIFSAMENMFIKNPSHECPLYPTEYWLCLCWGHSHRPRLCIEHHTTKTALFFKIPVNRLSLTITEFSVIDQFFNQWIFRSTHERAFFIFFKSKIFTSTNSCFMFINLHHCVQRKIELSYHTHLGEGSYYHKGSSLNSILNL